MTPDDPVEEEGVRRARARAGDADLVLWLMDSAGAAQPEGWLAESAAPVWIISTKTDVSGAAVSDAMLSISAERGDGMAALIAALVDFTGQPFRPGRGRVHHPRPPAGSVSAQCFSCSMPAVSAQHGDELVAEDLRAAAYQLGRLLGRVDVEDVLDSIFRDFCIGK